MFATGAVLIPSDPAESLDTLLRIGGIGIGVTQIGLGVATLAVGETLGGIAFIGCGVFLLALGVVSLRETTL